MGIQIRGLVKAFQTTRRTLQVGLAPSELDDFRRQIETLLAQVDSICRAHDATPHDLPAPSRKAYFFLKDINLEELPLREEGVDVPAHTLQISHVVKTGEQFAARIWQRLERLLESPIRRNTLLAQLHHHCDTIERLCAQHQATPAALGRPSQQVYCWLKFLSDAERFELHLEALARAQKVAQPYLDTLGATMDIHLVNMGSLWRLAPHKERLRLRCNEAFLHASEDVWDAMFGSMLSKRSKKRKARVTAFLETEAYNSVMFELQSFIEVSEFSSKGVVHDLNTSFERVNQGYFEGVFDAPHLTWSETPTTSKYGHYQFSTDTIMISTSLDRSDVPSFVVDFVMYHELLHKKHGIQIVDGRRIAHTPQFREEERMFEQYEESEAFLLHLSS